MKVVVDLFDYVRIPCLIAEKCASLSRAWIRSDFAQSGDYTKFALKLVYRIILVSSDKHKWIEKMQLTDLINFYSPQEISVIFMCLMVYGQRIKARPHKLFLSISRVLFIVYLLISLYRFCSKLHYLEKYFFFFFKLAMLPFTITTPYELEQNITVSRGSM